MANSIFWDLNTGHKDTKEEEIHYSWKHDEFLCSGSPITLCNGKTGRKFVGISLVMDKGWGNREGLQAIAQSWPLWKDSRKEWAVGCMSLRWEGELRTARPDWRVLEILFLEDPTWPGSLRSDMFSCCQRMNRRKCSLTVTTVDYWNRSEYVRLHSNLVFV